MFDVSLSCKLHGVRLETKHNLNQTTLISFNYVFVIAVFIFYFVEQLYVLNLSFIYLHFHYVCHQLFQTEFINVFLKL